MVPDPSPEEASPPEPLSGGWAPPSEVSVSDKSQSSSGRGPVLEGTRGGCRDARCTDCPSESSSELNGVVLLRRRKNEECVGEKENSKSHFTTCKHVWFAQSWPCLLPGPRRQARAILGWSSPCIWGLRKRGVRGEEVCLEWQKGPQSLFGSLVWTLPDTPPAHLALPLTCLQKTVGRPEQGHLGPRNHTTNPVRMHSLRLTSAPVLGTQGDQRVRVL